MDNLIDSAPARKGCVTSFSPDRQILEAAFRTGVIKDSQPILHPAESETGQVRKSTVLLHAIHQKPIDSIKPSPENDELYRPVDLTDPAIIGLAESIRALGVSEPLVISVDDFIISGHRRHAAAKLAGLKTVPCRIARVYHGQPDFVKLLREHNRQREKTNDEKLREAIIDVNPDREYAALIQHRAEKAVVKSDGIQIVGTKRRSTISAAKRPMLDAVRKVVHERKEFWPLTDRQVHYALLNDPPLRHASKPDSIYANVKQDYKDLTDLLTRARLSGEIPFEAISDETRPQIICDAHRTISGFVNREIDAFLRGYWRDLMQSQPNHVEVVGEKNTLLSVLRPVTDQFCIPLTIGRGYSSLPPRHAMAKRFRASGKSKLVVILLTDHDPDGDEIAHSFARSMRDDFGIEHNRGTSVSEPQAADLVRVRLREAAAISLAQAIAGGPERCPHPRTSQVLSAFPVIDALMNLAAFREEKDNG